MAEVAQGDILRVDGVSHPVIIVSNNFFNRSGSVIACPILKRATEGPLHIRLKESDFDGIVLCEQVRYLDLSARRYSKMFASHYYDIMDISDAVMGIFEYQ